WRKEGALREAPDAVSNVTVAHRPGREEVLTATAGRGRAGLRAWPVPEKGPLKDAPRGPGGPDVYPRALGLGSSKGDGRPDLAALVLRHVRQRGEKRGEYWLQLVSLGPDDFGAVRSRVKLWESIPCQPALATALGGRHVAVAGDDEHDIQI